MKKNWMEEYTDYILKNKTLKIALTLLFWMVFVIIFNIFCATTGLHKFSFNANNMKKILALEAIFYFLYTYLGNLLSLWFMEKPKSYPRIAVLSLPLSIMIAIVHKASNLAVGNIVLMFSYFLYRYAKHNKILSTVGYIITLFMIQSVFFILKYQIIGIDYSSLDNNMVRLLLGLDYYIFLYVIILIKNNIGGKFNMSLFWFPIKEKIEKCAEKFAKLFK